MSRNSTRNFIAKTKFAGVRKAKVATAKLVAKANQNRAYFAFYVLTNILVLLSYAFTIYKLRDPKGTITIVDTKGNEHTVKTAEFTKWDQRFVIIASIVLSLGFVGTIGFLLYASTQRKNGSSGV